MSPAPIRPRVRPGRRSVFFISWIALALLSTLWALATPLSAVPDEPAHFVKAASVVRGQFIGTVSPTGDELVQVPNYVGHSQALTCFAFQPATTANCSPAVSGNPWKTVDATTTAGLYNPVYYLIVGWPSLVFHDEVGLYAMRIVSGIVCALFLALALMVVSGWRRPVLPFLAVVLAVTPMVLFLNGSVNPNALEIATCLAVFAGVLGVFIDPRPDRLVERCVIVGISGAIAVNMRGLSPVWVLLAIVAPFVLAGKEQLISLLRRRSVLVAACGIVIAVAFALVWTATSNSLSVTSSDVSGQAPAPYTGSSPIVGFLGTLELTFVYARGMVGVFGWLDTPAPEGVFFLWSALAGALILAAVVLLRGRRLIFALVTIGGFLLLPPLFEAAFVRSGGIIWQGRYTLPIFVFVLLGLAAVLATHLDALSSRSTRRLILVVAVSLGLAQVWSFATALRRYAVGVNKSWIDLVLHPAWQPPLGVIGILALYVVITALASAAVILTAHRLEGDSADRAVRDHEARA